MVADQCQIVWTRKKYCNTNYEIKIERKKVFNVVRVKFCILKSFMS